MDIMKTLRITDFRKPMVIKQTNIPSVGEDDALIRVTASGVCRTDWHLWNQDWTWVGVNLPLPTTLGHEIGGIVEAVGKNVHNIKPGDRVTVPFNFACGCCSHCHGGEQNLCDEASWPFLIEGSGGFAEYVRVPNANLNVISLPENVTELDAAALGCRYMTAWRAVVAKAAIKGGETFIVVGMGGVGMAALEIALALGAQVIAVDQRDDRLAKAKKLGAFATVNNRDLTPEQVGEKIREMTNGHGANASMDAVGVSNAALTALESLAKGGRMSTVGLTSQADAGNLNIPVDKLVFKEWSISGSLGNPHSAYKELLNMINSGRLSPQQHVTRQIKLSEVQSVIDKMPDFEVDGYVVVTDFS